MPDIPVANSFSLLSKEYLATLNTWAAPRQLALLHYSRCRPGGMAGASKMWCSDRRQRLMRLCCVLPGSVVTLHADCTELKCGKPVYQGVTAARTAT